MWGRKKLAQIELTGKRGNVNSPFASGKKIPEKRPATRPKMPITIPTHLLDKSGKIGKSG